MMESKEDTKIRRQTLILSDMLIKAGYHDINKDLCDLTKKYELLYGKGFLNESM